MRFREVALVCSAHLALVSCGGGSSAPPTGDGGADATAPADARTTCPDDPPPPDMCDVFLGCGCDAAGGQKCSIDPEGRQCFSAGAAAEWDVCAGESDCGAGLSCIGYAGARYCMRFCDETHHCPTDEACYIRVTDTDVSVCGQVCGLLEQDCRFETQGCYTDDDVPEADRGSCVTAGTGVQDDPCERANDCAEGFTCVTPSGQASRCGKLCDLTDGDPGCDVGACQSLTGHVQTGVCLTP